jgi:exonuclease III
MLHPFLITNWVQNTAERIRKMAVFIYIYFQEALKFTNISLQKHCKEQDIEITAVQLKLNKKNVIIFCVYRAPSGDFDYFLNKLDYILNSLHTCKTEFIMCGDININYL